MKAEAAGRGYPAEAALVARWFERPVSGLRLEDGRPLKVIFPGVPGPGYGPDLRDAILEAGGDYLKGDVEFHLLASGWQGHGHRRDPAYGRVVLHVAGINDTGETQTEHGSGRLIPLLILRPLTQGVFPPPFTPPCAFKAAAGEDFGPRMRALSRRRLRMKAARVSPRIEAAGEGQALYEGLLETLGGPANREAFGAMARRMPLAALLERTDGLSTAGSRELALGAHLKGAATGLDFKQAGLRPSARPGRRLDAAAALVSALWPAGTGAGWPAALTPESRLPRTLQHPGVGRALAVELCANAVLPVALASGRWQEEAVLAAWHRLPSPGTYGRLRRLEGWLGSGGVRPFRGAAELQAGLLLHADYCSKGACGRCPLSSG